MKTFVVLTILLITHCICQAQRDKLYNSPENLEQLFKTPQDPEFFEWYTFPNGVKVSNSKIRPASRLVGVSQYWYWTEAITPVDSIAYTYTGGHGGDLTYTLKYTEKDIYTYSDSLKKYFKTNSVAQVINSAGNITTQIFSDFNLKTKSLSPDIKITFYYDAVNYDTLLLYQDWDTARHYNGWRNLYKERDRYDKNGNRIFKEEFRLFDPYVALEPAITGRSTYDSHNNITSYQSHSSAKEFWVHDSIKNIKFIHHYNSKGIDTLKEVFQYNYTDSTWQPVQRTFKIYNNGEPNDSTYTSQDYEKKKSGWVKDVTNSSEKDKIGNDTLLTCKLWHIKNALSDIEFELKITYNKFNQPVTIIKEVPGITGQLYKECQYRFYYQTYSIEK